MDCLFGLLAQGLLMIAIQEMTFWKMAKNKDNTVLFGNIEAKNTTSFWDATSSWSRIIVDDKTNINYLLVRGENSTFADYRDWVF